jgi:osmoprotectant transport system permease protein
VVAVLNVAQVLPALSFIGLLIVPMGWLGANVAALGAIGVSGIGWAPVFVVLLSYALYPITRNVVTSLKSLDLGVTDAARGMGMKPRQRLLSVELPLSFPVVLAGVRIAAVQTTSAAILAALVGGGGLGQIVFFGVQQTASDLVLLGVIPIVGLALTFDASLRFLEGVVRSAQGGGLT